MSIPAAQYHSGLIVRQTSPIAPVQKRYSRDHKNQDCREPAMAPGHRPPINSWETEQMEPFLENRRNALRCWCSSVQRFSWERVVVCSDGPAGLRIGDGIDDARRAPLLLAWAAWGSRIERGDGGGTFRTPTNVTRRPVHRPPRLLTAAAHQEAHGCAPGCLWPLVRTCCMHTRTRLHTRARTYARMHRSTRREANRST